MTWTYALSLLPTSQLMQIRLIIGDTIPTSEQLQDEEIDYFISMAPTSNYSIANLCASSLASKYSQLADETEGDITIKYSDLAKAWTKRAANFAYLAITSGAALPYAGGISIQDKISQEENPDRVGPQFTIGIMDNSVPIPSGGPETLDTSSGETQNI